MSQSSGKVKAGALWTKNKEDLTKQLGELKTELGQLKIQKITSSGSKLNKMYVFDPPGSQAFQISASQLGEQEYGHWDKRSCNP
jgi:ribosomal protein L29